MRISALALLSLWLLSMHASGEPAVVGKANWDARASRTMREALADYAAVIRGQNPIFAKLDRNQVFLYDGGSRSYVGHGYKLDVLQSLSTIAGVSGYVYGPSVSFDPAIAPGNTSTLTHYVFYTLDEFKKLRRRKT